MRYSAAETLRSALALGADSGTHIQTDVRIDQELRALTVANVFRKIIMDKSFDFSVIGKQSFDDEYNQTG